MEPKIYCLPTLLNSIKPEKLILHQVYEDRFDNKSTKLTINTLCYNYESIREFEKYSELTLRRKDAK